MPISDSKDGDSKGRDSKDRDPQAWEQQLRDAAARAEEELRRVVTYINDEVVPEVRKNGSRALRAAGQELQKLAQRMDDHHKAASAGRDKDQPKP